MMKPNKSNEDPGGTKPRFHNGQPNLPIVKITNSQREVVQITPHLSFPYSAGTVKSVRELMSANCNGTAISAGMVMHPSITQPDGQPIPDGTLIHAFPVAYTPEEKAIGFGRHLEIHTEEFTDGNEGMTFHGFVADASSEVLKMVTKAAKAAHQERQRELEPSGHPTLKVITAEGEETDVGPESGRVELNHEAASGDDEQGEESRDGVRARAVEA